MPRAAWVVLWRAAVLAFYVEDGCSGGWKDGYLYGGHPDGWEEYLGEYESREDCVDAARRSGRTVGATWGKRLYYGSKLKCYAEYGQTRVTDSSEKYWEYCLFPSPTPAPTVTSAPTASLPPTVAPMQDTTNADDNGDISLALILGIVIGAVLVVGIVIFAIWKRRNPGKPLFAAAADLVACLVNHCQRFHRNLKDPNEAPGMHFIGMCTLALLCFGVQMYAILPAKNRHWATVATEKVNLVDIPSDIEETYPILEVVKFKYDLWDSKQNFCFHDNDHCAEERAEDYSYYGHFSCGTWRCSAVKSKIKSGENFCAGGNSYCEDLVAATRAARWTTVFAALVFAAVGVLGFVTNPFHSAYGIKADKPFSSKIISAFSALLAVGGLVGWTGTAAYWGRMAAAATKVGGKLDGGHSKSIPCKRGCYVTIITGCVAMVVGAAFVIFYLDPEDWRSQAKQPDAFAAGEDVASTPDRADGSDGDASPFSAAMNRVLPTVPSAPPLPPLPPPSAPPHFRYGEAECVTPVAVQVTRPEVARPVAGTSTAPFATVVNVQRVVRGWSARGLQRLASWRAATPEEEV